MRHSKRHGDGFAWLGGDSKYQRAPEGATTSALIPFALRPFALVLFALVPFALLTICSIAHRSRRLLYMSSALYVN